MNIAVQDGNSNPKKRFGITKVPMHLIPPVAAIEEAAVMGLGAKKYGAYNWLENHVDASTYIAAIERHLKTWQTGEDVDPESGCSHLAHVRACCGILLDALYSGSLVDDRPKGAASASEAIARLTVHPVDTTAQAVVEGRVDAVREPRVGDRVRCTCYAGCIASGVVSDIDGDALACGDTGHTILARFAERVQ